MQFDEWPSPVLSPGWTANHDRDESPASDQPVQGSGAPAPLVPHDDEAGAAVRHEPGSSLTNLALLLLGPRLPELLTKAAPAAGGSIATIALGSTALLAGTAGLFWYYLGSSPDPSGDKAPEIRNAPAEVTQASAQTQQSTTYWQTRVHQLEHAVRVATAGNRELSEWARRDLQSLLSELRRARQQVDRLMRPSDEAATASLSVKTKPQAASANEPIRTAQPDEPDPGKPCSMTWIGAELYVVNDRTPPDTRAFLSRVGSHRNYDTEAQLHAQAADYMRHAAAERAIVLQTANALMDPDSIESRQMRHMNHLERSYWTRLYPLQERPDEAQARSASLVERITDPGPRRGYAVSRVPLSPELQRAYTMLVTGEQGPWQHEWQAGVRVRRTDGSERQIAGGLQFSQMAQMLSRYERWASGNEADEIDENRHFFVTSQGIRATRSGIPASLNLSDDIAARVLQEHQLPVMTGVSGTSAEALLMALFNARQAGVSWIAPDLTEDEARWALERLCLHYLRSEAAAPQANLAARLNLLRSSQGQPPMQPEPGEVTSHTLGEIMLAVAVTLGGGQQQREEEIEALMQREIPEIRRRYAEYASLATPSTR